MHPAAMITQSDLGFTGRKKMGVFSDEMVPHFTPHFIAPIPISHRKNGLALFSVRYSGMCTMFSKKNYPPSCKGKPL